MAVDCYFRDIGTSFNFGKYKGQSVAEVLRRDPNYYNWMMEKDFTLNTKNVLTRIRMRDIMAKPR